MNLGVTSPAAALALGLMYLQVPLLLLFVNSWGCGSGSQNGSNCVLAAMHEVEACLQACCSHHPTPPALPTSTAQHTDQRLSGCGGLPPARWASNAPHLTPMQAYHLLGLLAHGFTPPAPVTCIPPAWNRCAADTHFALDFVQPEQLTLRMLMRSLGGWRGKLRDPGQITKSEGCCFVMAIMRIMPHMASLPRAPYPAVMWDSIQPTDEWLQAQLPPLLRGPLSRLMAGRGGGAPHADYEALAQVSCCLCSDCPAGQGLAGVGPNGSAMTLPISDNVINFPACRHTPLVWRAPALLWASALRGRPMHVPRRCCAATPSNCWPPSSGHQSRAQVGEWVGGLVDGRLPVQGVSISHALFRCAVPEPSTPLHQAGPFCTHLPCTCPQASPASSARM